MLKLFLAVLAGVALISFSSYAAQISDAQICRAAMSTIMDQKLEDVEFKREVKQVKYINIPPSKDNSTFKFKCTATGGKIQWASEFGTWRDSDLDSKVSYDIKEGFLFVREKYNSGYTFNKRFNLNDFDSE